MFTTELSAVMQCDRCEDARNAVSIPIIIGPGGGVGCRIDDLVLPKGWARIETRFYKRLHVCSGCVKTGDKIIYEGITKRTETLSAVL